MKIERAYIYEKKQALFVAQKKLDRTALLVTELNNPDINLLINDQHEIKTAEITCLRFQCSLEDFISCKPDVLNACKNFIKLYPCITHLEFFPSIRCDVGFLKVLIDSKHDSLWGTYATITMHLMKNIYAMQNTPLCGYLPDTVACDICKCISAYIGENNYVKFHDMFKKHFKPEEAHKYGVNATIGAMVLFLGLFWTLSKTAHHAGYHLPALAACMGSIVYASGVYIPPNFAIKRGEVNFESAASRMLLTQLYEDIGGRERYELWDTEIAALQMK